MTRLLAAAALAAASLALVPTSANACTGVVCNAVCDAWNSKVGQLVFDDTCPLR